MRRTCDGPAPWDIGEPQPAIVRLAARGRIRRRSSRCRLRDRRERSISHRGCKDAPSARGCSRSAPGRARRGNDTGSFPPGFTSPNTTSATAWPAWTPGNHASRIAGASSITSSSASGRPLNSTTTNGLPVALIALDQLLLPAGQVERAARRRLAAHLARLAEGEHDLVGRLRRRRPPRRSRRRSRSPRDRCAAARCCESLQPSA